MEAKPKFWGAALSPPRLDLFVTIMIATFTFNKDGKIELILGKSLTISYKDVTFRLENLPKYQPSKSRNKRFKKNEK